MSHHIEMECTKCSLTRICGYYEIVLDTIREEFDCFETTVDTDLPFISLKGKIKLQCEYFDPIDYMKEYKEHCDKPTFIEGKE